MEPTKEPVFCAENHSVIAFYGKQCPLCVHLALLAQASQHIENLCHEIDILTAAMVEAGIIVKKLPEVLPKNLRFIDQKRKSK